MTVREKRSILNFIVLAIFGLSTTIFLLNRAQVAVDEITRLSQQRIYLIRDIEENRP